MIAEQTAAYQKQMWLSQLQVTNPQAYQVPYSTHSTYLSDSCWNNFSQPFAPLLEPVPEGVTVTRVFSYCTKFGKLLPFKITLLISTFFRFVSSSTPHRSHLESLWYCFHCLRQVVFSPKMYFFKCHGQLVKTNCPRWFRLTKGQGAPHESPNHVK